MSSVLSDEELAYLKNPDNEEGVIDIIKRKLITPDQKAVLFETDLTIADCLNGRYGGEQEAVVQMMYKAWNRLAGEHLFGDEHA